MSYFKKTLDLTDFNFWSGAKEHEFTNEELKQLEFHFEEIFPDLPTETEVNDMFWFEEEFLCSFLSIDYGEYCER